MPSDSNRAYGSSGLGPGTVLDGKYEILARIGAGGMGEVFKARHLHLNAFRCIKVMKQELLAHTGRRTRPERLADPLARTRGADRREHRLELRARRRAVA